MNPLLKTGASKPLESSDIGPPLPQDEAEAVHARLKSHWDRLKAKSDKPSLGWALVSPRQRGEGGPVRSEATSRTSTCRAHRP